MVPPNPIAEFFALARQATLRAHRQATDRGRRTLAALRDTLLPKLISGELRVEDTERVIARSNWGV